MSLRGAGCQSCNSIVTLSNTRKRSPFLLTCTVYLYCSICVVLVRSVERGNESRMTKSLIYIHTEQESGGKNKHYLVL
jgi:hypothetical protein